MATQVPSVVRPVPKQWAGEMRYVARQPILNRRGHVHAYELIFRNPPDAILDSGADLAARTMLDNGVIFGLEWLTNGLPAFVSCTAESLSEELVLVLEPQSAILAIPAGLNMTPRLLDACGKLKSRGFRFAMDDFEWQPGLRPFAELSGYIRVDFNRFGNPERQYLQKLRGEHPALVAKHVETQSDYQKACEAGFTFFQGAYFCHPVLMKKRKVPANRLLHFEIVRMLHHDPVDVDQISKLVLRDASLTYRLLRLVNSPLYAIQQEVRSIGQAIFAVGENNLRRIVSLAVLSEINGEEPPEILHMALIRARFCEITAGLRKLDPSEQYLLGMLSLVPAMLRLPMEELTPSLPLRAEICEALQGAQNPERCMLSWLENHERGDWDSCDAIVQANGLHREDLVRHYAESAAWAWASVRGAA